jgi:hypothetical protein
MRLFVVLLLLVGVQNNSHPNNPKGETSKNPDNSCQPSVVEIHTSCTPETRAGHGEQQTTKAEVKPFMTHGEIVISVITGIYVIIAFFTLLAILRQAHIAEMSTDATIDAERAWFDLDLKDSGPDKVELIVTNYGKMHGIMINYTFAYAHMTQLEYDELPKKLEEEDETWGTRQTLHYGGLVPANKNFSILPVDLASFIGKPERDLNFIDVFYFKVAYETMGQDCYTEAVYLLHQTYLPIKRYNLVSVPGLAHYE